MIDLLDGSFAALRQRARTMVTLVAGLVVPLSLLQAWVARDDLGGATFTDLLNDPTVAEEVSRAGSVYDVGFFVAQGVGLLVTAVAGVGVARVMAGWFDGREVTAGEAIAFVGRRAGPILGAFVVVHVAELIGILLLVLPGLAAIVLFSLTSPVLAVEQLGPVAAVRRSAELVRRRAAAVVGVIVLVGIVQYAVSQAVGTLPGLVALFIGPDRAWPLVAASNLLTSIILVPVNGAAMCLVYYDIRFRTEGLDLRRRIDRTFDRPGNGP